MKFSVENKVFDKLPTVCFGLVAVYGIDNSNNKEIFDLLDSNVKICKESLEGHNVKEIQEVACFRNAFRELGINPNKFMCSIEALLSRISKGNAMPSINSAVDLGNSVSLKYKLPIGAHDIDTTNGELSIRYATEIDSFIPFGSQNSESADKDEIVYVSGNEIRTRRWIWRQSEIGKITEHTKNILFPIDGFSDVNKDKILAAQKELSELLTKYFDCKVFTGFVDKNNPEYFF